MPYDLDKIDDVTLALLHLVTHRRHKIGPWRAWKGFDWDTMDRLHEKGFIGDPVGKAKSVVLTEEGYERSVELFEQFFGLEDSDGGPPPSNPDELVGHDALLDYELEVDDELEPLELSLMARADLKEVFGGGGSDAEIYLDTQTGEVLRFSEYDGVSFDDDPHTLGEYERRIWEQRVAIMQDSDGRFLWVEPLETREAWRNMAAFTDLVQDDALRTELADAIEGRGAFSRFRRVLDRHEPLRQAWFSFRDARAQKRMRDWLAIEGYELVEEE